MYLCQQRDDVRLAGLNCRQVFGPGQPVCQDADLSELSRQARGVHRVLPFTAVLPEQVPRSWQATGIG